MGVVVSYGIERVRSRKYGMQGFGFRVDLICGRAPV